jgi:hypothetical protein
MKIYFSTFFSVMKKIINLKERIVLKHIILYVHCIDVIMIF